MVEAQGGDKREVYDTSLLPAAKLKLPVLAKETGYVCGMETSEIGIACMTLGGGRETKESVIDLSVGIELVKKVGEPAGKGDVLAYLYANDEKKAEAAKKIIENAYHFGAEEFTKPKTIHAVITA